MAKHTEPDRILMKMPSLRAIRSFVAAAKYQSFTSAAESLCVTQAAISRQIRELEATLGIKLFNRVGRTVELTEEGSIFYDAAYLSFVNIAQAAQRIDQHNDQHQEVTICCSPAFSALWLTSNLPQFCAQHPEVKVNVISTNNFLNLEPGAHPDLFISKTVTPREGYASIPLFYDVIYPVCSPEYLKQHADCENTNNLANSKLLNLSPYGRAQLAEHVDWDVWLTESGNEPPLQGSYSFTSNDYNLLIQSTLNHQGICLGWHHLVDDLIKQGKLVKVGKQELIYREKCHYLVYDETKTQNAAFAAFRDWLLYSVSQLPTSIVEDRVLQSSTYSKYSQ
ncbi:LysR substrate-binding domain-containing protein [Vibrio sp. STUT-A11]|uniref:LysR substrate-binding domain-containing protein n=1 Tax=Vibrio sp. STUT-A11 TaxID=2976236 RepID=UPI00223175CD|nr:LysR substrate-binding domain-containing protein [Vibrio sp. STUT-A11]BDR13466.1 LysR family transcriptional regulator [Vibrio sp. STUT-A11]